MYLKLLLIITILGYSHCSSKVEICSKNEWDENSIFLNHHPKGLSIKSAKIFKTQELSNIDLCVRACCDNKKCDSILYNNTHCDLIRCKSSSDCVAIDGDATNEEQYYIILRSSISNIDQRLENKSRKTDHSNDDNSICELNIDESCPANQICHETEENSKSGLCICKTGFTKRGNQCIEDAKMTSTSAPTTHRMPTLKKTSTSGKVTPQKTDASDRKSKPLQFSANAGPDIYVKVLRSSLINKPDIISVPGMVRIKNNKFNAENFIYSWKRLPESLAVGTIVNNSLHEPTLLLTNLLQGVYVFELTVTSLDGSQSKDVVKLNVVEIDDESSTNLIDIVLMTNIYQFTEKDKESFSKRMAHIIEKDLSISQSVVEIHSIVPYYNNNTHIIFYSKMFHEQLKIFQVMSSWLQEKELRNKILKHKFIFDYAIEKFQSRICYNECGGHGVCDQKTHVCNCNFPWFNNIFHQQSTGYTNCDMHAMIIVVSCAVGIFLLVLLTIILRKIIQKIRLRTKYGKKKFQYKVLEDTDT